MSLKSSNANLSQRFWRIAAKVASKEMLQFFSSSVAWLFFACFAAITLFVVFWGEAYFARNIADVRPMFEWMPILLILLSSTITMRMWSEERRTGSLEHVLTQPASLWAFAVGKYLACMGLLVLALLVLLPLPITLSSISDIDWGPVWAGFLATVLLGSAYISMGLFVSSRTQNQIVSLIGSVVLCSIFYFIGHAVIVNTLGQSTGEWLQAIGTGSRFDAITRGIIDLSDLIYYLSLTLIFIVLAVYSLERERWSRGAGKPLHHRWLVASTLLVLNAFALNLWMGQVSSLRLDTTRGQQYSLSDATRNYLAQLQEPLTLRGYFSAKTHPLLSPLVPQMRDLLSEYEVAGKGRVRVEIIDPLQNPDTEAEANQQFGIEPVPFQIADRYQSSIVSSYFDVLVQYGDEYDVLGFRDLIDIKARSETDIDVQLRNPEYDLTRSIRKVLTDFQTAGNVFNNIDSPVNFTIYASDDSRLPLDLANFKSDIQKKANELAGISNGRFEVTAIDPRENGGAVANELANNYGFRPMSAGLFSRDRFWFHLLLSGDDQIVQLPLDDLSTAAFEKNLDKGLKRFAKGLTRRVGLVTPGATPGNPAQPGTNPSFRSLQEFLGSEYDVVNESLDDGSVANDIDMLILASPKSLDEKSLFAVDQFLMQGGTVLVSSSDWQANFTRGRIDLTPHDSGLKDWLEHNGISIDNSLVMDPQNASFPAPVARNVGGIQIQEMRMLDYPWFVDIRKDGMGNNNPILADVEQVNITWASPITLEEESDTTNRTTSILLSSSAESWLSSSTNVMPRMDSRNSRISPWEPEGETGEHALAVSVQGQFNSYFAGKPSPLATVFEEESSDESITATEAIDDLANELSGNSSSSVVDADSSESDEAEIDRPSLNESIDNVIERSTGSARLIVFASNDFLRDQITRVAGSANGTAYIAPFQLIANAVDVSLDDTGLLSIRSRGQFSRTLPPMDDNDRQFWETLNYVLAIIAIAALYLISRVWRKRTERKQLELIAS